VLELTDEMRTPQALTTLLAQDVRKAFADLDR
jgi:hypothetical protein